MYRISLSPQLSNVELRIEKSRSFLKINGEPCYFGTLNDGDEIPAEAITSNWVIGSIIKYDGVVHLTVIMPYSDAEAPEHIRFPEPIMMIADGEIVFNEKVAADD